MNPQVLFCFSESPQFFLTHTAEGSFNTTPETKSESRQHLVCWMALNCTFLGCDADGHVTEADHVVSRGAIKTSSDPTELFRSTDPPDHVTAGLSAQFTHTHTHTPPVHRDHRDQLAIRKQTGPGSIPKTQGSHQMKLQRCFCHHFGLNPLLMRDKGAWTP